MNERLEKNIEDLLRGRMINRGAWRVDDENWIARRKQAWKEIERRLKYLETPKRKLKLYEKYYLTGHIPRVDPLADSPSICLFYLLWWHPDQSEDNWIEIRDTIQYIGEQLKLDQDPWFWRIHYEESQREFLVGAGRWGNMAPDEGFPDGLMGGGEERMLNFLIDIDRFDEGEMVYGIRAAYWLQEPDEICNRYAVYQYDKFVNRWREYLVSGAMNRHLNYPDARNWHVQFFQAVAEFPLEDRGPDHFKSVFVSKIRHILDDDPIPDEFSKLWQEAKETARLQ